MVTTWCAHGIARINAFLQEHFAGAQTVQIFNAEKKSVEKFREINADYRKANIDTIFYYAVFFPLVDFIGAVGMALIIWYGGYRVMQNTPEHTVLTLGALVAFIQYSGFLFQPIRDISDKYNVLQSAVVASHRIFKTLDLPIAITSPDKPAKSGRALGTSNLKTFGLPTRMKTGFLKMFRSRLEPGQSIALVGHTGSGKTTITNLLMRFYDVQRGRILVGRRRHARAGTCKPCGKTSPWCSRKYFFSAGQLKAIFVLGARTFPRERVQWAAQEVRAEPFIMRLKRDYQAEVKERGAGLSVGQKQLISFARALAFDPAILILDEATSSIDTETEQLIQQAIERVMRDRTSIVVAHRLSTVQRADQIIVLHHGEIREQGTHQELLAQHGLYWKLYRLQYADGAAPRTSLPPVQRRRRSLPARP